MGRPRKLPPDFVRRKERCDSCSESGRIYLASMTICWACLPKARQAELRHSRLIGQIANLRHAVMEPDESRKGSCHLCALFSENLQQDHDHMTGMIRGYICTACNLGLGCFRDNLSRLKEAIRYLEDADRNFKMAAYILERTQTHNEFDIKRSLRYINQIYNSHIVEPNLSEIGT